MEQLSVNSPSAPTTFVYDTTKPRALPAAKKPNLLPLYNEKNPMLATRMPEFNILNPPCNIVEFANQLLYTMAHYGGVGLAAPQCGFPYRIFVMAGGVVCINPVILEASTETARQKEGCLSFPGLSLPIERAKTVRVKYTNEKGERVEATWSGVTAQVAQHEYDHLEGKVFTSRVGSLTLQMAKKKRQKLFKKIQRIVDAKATRARIDGKVSSRLTTETTPNPQMSPTAVESTNR